MFELNGTEQMIVDVTREWVDTTVRPQVQKYDHTDTYPTEMVEQMKAMGFFGLLIPEEYGGNKVSTLCFARVTEEIARGWMSLSGALGSHSVTAYLILTHGTEAQRRRYLPDMATGAARAAMALTEPGGGSDLQAMTTYAARSGDHYVINGAKTFITNAQHARYFSLLAKTDRTAQPAHKGITLFIAEAGPGLTVTRKLDKLGYKGTETCELAFEDYCTPVESVLGGEGKGFGLMMDGLEIGRIQVACRALGVAAAAFEESVAYAQERTAFGKPIWQHQAVGHHLAEMATKLEAARLLTYQAAQLKDSGRRCDMEAGMAKYYASEVCGEITMTAMRVFGGYGYMKEYNIDRYYRDAPLMIIGEGTNEIQKNVIARQLVNRYPI